MLIASPEECSLPGSGVLPTSAPPGGPFVCNLQFAASPSEHHVRDSGASRRCSTDATDSRSLLRRTRHPEWYAAGEQHPPRPVCYGRSPEARRRARPGISSSTRSGCATTSARTYRAALAPTPTKDSTSAGMVRLLCWLGDSPHPLPGEAPVPSSRRLVR